MKLKIKQSENEVSRDVKNYLSLSGYKCWRVNNGAVFNQKRNTWIYHGEKGLPDLVCASAKLKVALFVETKSSIGKIRPEQAEFLELVNKCDKVVGLCIHSLEELIEGMRK